MEQVIKLISDFLEQNSQNRAILSKFKDSENKLLGKYDTTISFEELSIDELEEKILRLNRSLGNKSFPESAKKAIPASIVRIQKRIKELEK